MFMKKIALLLITGFVSFMLNAAGYKVAEIPNVHISDSTRFVTNPDGVLSLQGESQANMLLRDLMRNTTAEVFVVAVNAIDEESDINDFATELFRYWGIGKKDNNNGLLILIDKGRRMAVYRTGNGLEGLLPDGLLGTLHRQKVVPEFRNENYDEGVMAALTVVSQILTSEEGRAEVLSELSNNTNVQTDSDELFYLYFSVAIVISLLSLLVVIYKYIASRGKARTERYSEIDRLKTPLLIITFLTCGLGLIAFLVAYLIRRDLRYRKHLCPECSTRMNLVSETRDNDFLSRQQDIEERVGSVDYDVWLCPNCAETEIIPYKQRTTSYAECPVCKACAMHVVSDRVSIRPTHYQEGLQVMSWRCLSCGHEDVVYITLPKTAAPPPVVFIPGGGGRGGFGGGFGGGSMGGGTTSGGGFSGGW